jgi:hypothetical protein
MTPWMLSRSVGTACPPCVGGEVRAADVELEAVVAEGHAEATGGLLRPVLETTMVAMRRW